MNRSSVASIVLIVVLLGSAAGLVALQYQQTTFIRGWEVATTSEATALPYRLPLVGVNVDLTQYNTDELAAHLEAMQRLGVVWVRQPFRWADIESARGEYEWADWDRVVDVVSEHPPLRLVAVLLHTPSWARHDQAPASSTAPPARNSDFAAFAAAFAARYGDRIDYYQIWDEPNLAIGWGGLNPNPADYVALLQAAYSAIHAQDSTATVIAAGLAPTTERGPQNYSDVLFLRAMYSNGVADYFDALAGKPYGFDTGPHDRRVDEDILNFSRLILLREEMVSHGDADKALWASHFGWNALPEDWEGRPSIWGRQSRADQLAFIREAYARATREWPWTGGLILESWQPRAPTDDPVWGFALLRPGDSLADLPSDLFTVSDEGNAAIAGRYPALNPYAAYSGDWEFGDLGADVGYANDGQFTFEFVGTEVALELRRGNYRAYLYVTVDDAPANALPIADDGRSYTVLTSADALPHVDIITVARDLPPGRHQLTARAEFGWDQWPVAGFRVADPPDFQAFRQQTTALGVLGVSALVMLVVFDRGRRLGLPVRLRMAWLRLRSTGQILVSVAVSLLLALGMTLTWNDHLPAIFRRDLPALLLGVITSGALYFSESFILVLVTGALLWYQIFLRLELGLLLTLLWSPFFLYPLTLYAYAFPMAEVCILLTATAWITRLGINWARQRHTQQTTRLRLRDLHLLDWGMLFLVVLATLSLFWSDYQRVAVREWRTLILEPALFYLVARSTLRQRAEIVHLVDAFVLAATLAAGISLMLYISGQGVIFAEGGSQRLAGVYGSPNNIGLLVGRALPFAVAFFLTTQGRLRRVWSLAASIVLGLAAILSKSAGALLLGIPASLLLLLFLWDRRAGIIATAASAISGLIALGPLQQSPRFARILDFSSGSTFFRLKLWESAWRMIADRPLQGYGLDQFLYHYRGRYIALEAWQEPNLSHPHNVLLDFWIRLGLGGVILLIAVQTVFWRSCLTLYRALHRDKMLWAVVLGAMASMLDVLLHGLVDNSVFVLDLSYIYVLLMVLPPLLERHAEP
ncbi:MAG: hypothetical protein HPY64_08650 [Anaerolineae bacterium]|nr:hypothetical protein [Anaerolineae bacterium]